MSGKLLNNARKDALKINKAIGWEDDIKLSTPDNSLTANLKGIHTKHHLAFDDLGQRVNAKNAHVLIAEKDLLNAFNPDFDTDFNTDFKSMKSYPYRNQTGNVALLGHFVDVADSNGDVKKFIINETYPSETFGLIVCILGDIDKKSGTHGNIDRRNNRFR